MEKCLIQFLIDIWIYFFFIFEFNYFIILITLHFEMHDCVFWWVSKEYICYDHTWKFIHKFKQYKIEKFNGPSKNTRNQYFIYSEFYHISFHINKQRIRGEWYIHKTISNRFWELKRNEYVGIQNYEVYLINL